MTRPAPTVIKVGGSLLDWSELPARLTTLLASRRASQIAGPTILIAGGGAAVDFVRRLDRVHDLGETRSHLLALYTLDLTARLLATLLPGASAVVDSLPAVASAWSGGLIPILAPYRFMTEVDARGTGRLLESWDVTSDSIAARVAVSLQAERLLLLKSRALPPGTSREDAASLGFVDAAFPQAARPLARVEYLNLRGATLEAVPLPPAVDSL